MAPEPRFRRLRGALVAAAVAAASAAKPAHALRIVNYNVTNYPAVLLAQRQPNFRIVLAPLGADIMTCQEFQSQAGVDSFRTNVLNVIEPGQWSSAPFVNGNDTDNAFFYKPSKVQFLGMWTFYPNPANQLRLVNCYRVKPVGYSDAAAEIRIYSQHLKASTGSTNVAQRQAEAIGIRDSMNAIPPGTHAILLGDFNIYTTTEPAFQKFLESQVDNDGRLYDPYNLSGTFNQAAFAPYHTQCPCLTCPTGSGFSGGGLDDRFDMFLPTYNMNDGEGLDLVPGTYIPVGNDGLHYNLNINDPPVIPEGQAYANALWNASDHLPIRVDIQVPSRISVAGGPLAFGTVIVGAAPSQNLSITNPATLPADELDYSFTAPAGFGAPGGPLTLNAGAPAAVHAITMSTASAGNPAGNLSIASDDPDHPTTLIALSGTVLDHAAASLDSSAVVLGETVDFGDHPAGAFTDQLARVHDYGYDALQARLALSAGVITGGAGRFSIVGGFTPALIAGVGQSYELAFDDLGATPDSTYDGALTFSSGDEALPGAAAQPNLVVTLRARVTGGVTAVGDRATPRETRLLAPSPNPLVRATTLRFDLARAAHVRLDVFALDGRRVATVADRAYDAGRYSIDWNGRGAGGARLGAGLYFVRMSGTGLRPQSLRLAIVR